MTHVPSDASSLPRAERTRVGIIGHIGHDKSSLIAALELLNRQAKARGERADALDVLPSTPPSEDWPEATFRCDRRPSWKVLKEEARRSNRRGRRRP